MSSRRLVPSLLLASAVALAPLPAHADAVTTRDADHDVAAVDLDGDRPQSRPQPGRAEGDIVWMRVNHGAGAVRIRLRTAQLTRDSGQTTVPVFALRTNEGRRAELSLFVDAGRWQGQRVWTVNDRRRTCRGLSSHIDYRAGTVEVKVPRRCLSNPRWVRVGGGIGIFSDSQLYADDANQAGRVSNDLPLGPRVGRA